ncbi:hypothetical protein WI86_16550 [Burkholderia ubonensis]|nr:hypothetical protein WI86_16550 [Burkholderia ubonensis]
MSKLRGKRAVSYLLKSNLDDGKRVGVIAQEWLDDFPELVREGADIDPAGNFVAPGSEPDTGCRKSLGFEYGNGFAILLAALLELDTSLTEARAEISELRSRCK